MPGRKIKIHFKGQEVEAETVEVAQAQERWNEYLLDDGTTLKMKVVVANVYRVEGQYDGEGNPVYITHSTQVVSVNAPQELRKQWQ